MSYIDDSTDGAEAHDQERRRSWESRMRAAFERAIRIMARDRGFDPIDEVVLLGEYPSTEIAVIFHLQSRPGCRFGYSWGTFWDEVDADVASGRASSWDVLTPDGWSAFNVAIVNSVEAMSSPPIQCESGRVTWYREKLSGLEDATRRMPFPIVVPTWLPPGSQLFEVFFSPATPVMPDYLGISYQDASQRQETILHETAEPLWPGARWSTAFQTDDKQVERLEQSGGSAAWRTSAADGRCHVLILSGLDEPTISRIATSLKVVGNRGA